jgi:bifunctional non-homologous end joining protein LigD
MPKRDYASKRSMDATPEPAARVAGNVDPTTARPGSTFVIHQHHARRLHFDLRLEMYNGDTPVLVSWAVPRNLPSKTGAPHLAVHTEDHPFEYVSFSGTIPSGQYGAGEMRIFDSGTYEVLEQEKDKLSFRLKGSRLQGVWHIARPRNEDRPDDWLAFLKENERPEREPLPELIPMAAMLSEKAFDNDDWLFEIKWDGVRAISVCIDEETLVLSRTHRDITSTYPELQRLYERLVALEAVVDGEIVALSGGKPSFEKLQSRMNLQNEHEIQRAMKSCPITYVVFDLLYLDGRNLISEPVEERKRLLADVIVPNEWLQVSHSESGIGIALFDAAKERGLEGIVAKKLGSPYRPGKRTKEWQKIKAVHDGDLVVGGWSRGEGSRSSTFGALLLGAYDGDDLIFVGAVGTGFSDIRLKEILPELKAHEIDECPFAGGVGAVRAGRFGKPIRDPHWADPVLVAQIEYRELTSGAHLRAPSFKGLRIDKSPEDCLLEELPGRA